MGELKFESELVFAKRSVQWIIILAISCVMMRMMHCRPVVPLRPAVLNEQLPDDVSVRWGQQAEHPVSARSEGMRRGGGRNRCVGNEVGHAAKTLARSS